MNREQIFPQPDFIPVFEKWGKLKGTTIGITGHRGTLGSIIIKRFQQAGIKISTYPGDILDNEKLSGWFQRKQFSHFFHFAAVVPTNKVEKNPLEAFETNAIGTFNLCKQILNSQKKAGFLLLLQAMFINHLKNHHD